MCHKNERQKARSVFYEFLGYVFQISKIAEVYNRIAVI